MAIVFHLQGLINAFRYKHSFMATHCWRDDFSVFTFDLQFYFPIVDRTFAGLDVCISHFWPGYVLSSVLHAEGHEDENLDITFFCELGPLLSTEFCKTAEATELACNKINHYDTKPTGFFRYRYIDINSSKCTPQASLQTFQSQYIVSTKFTSKCGNVIFNEPATSVSIQATYLHRSWYWSAKHIWETKLSIC